MILLHASFDSGRLLLWGEQPDGSSAVTVRRGGRAPKRVTPVPSPYDVSVGTLHKALEEIPLLSLAALPPTTVTVWLPTDGKMPLASSPLIAAPPETVAPLQIVPWQVTALPLTTEQATLLLSSSLNRDTLAPGVLLGASLLYWATALRFAGAMVARQQFLPSIEGREGGYRAFWQPMYASADAERLRKLAQAMPNACRAVTVNPKADPPEQPAQVVLSAFLSEVCDHLVRTASASPSPAPPRTGKSKWPAFASLHDQWLYALRSPDGRVEGDRAELKAFTAQVREWKRPLFLTLAAPFRLCFRLEEPTAEEGSTGPESLWNVRYLLQALDDPSLLVPVENAWNTKTQGSEAHLLHRNGFQPREYLLAALGQAAKLNTRIEASLKAAAPGGYTCDTASAHQFLTETAWMLEQAGFGILLPAWWTRKGTKLHLSAHASVKSPKLKADAGLSLKTLMEFDWQLALGEEMLTLDELEILAQQKTGLVRMRGQWVQLDAEEIAAAIRFWKSRKAEKATLRDVVRMSLGVGSGPGGIPIAGVKASGQIEEFLARLHGQATLDTPVPAAFAGTLRPYQQRGYAWLEFLREWGLGACLADDMGLGKTAQTLALIQRQWEVGDKRPTLIICPTSVVGNWQKEAQRFTPGLPVMAHHGLGRAKGDLFQQQAAQQALVLSSYALLNRDFEHLKGVDWAGIILDEAQNIKNPETKQARAARSLQAGYRIALTGTPVENHIGDLWSLMEFINPGFLGTQAEFKRNFFIPIQTENDPEATMRLKRLTAPFLLRRLKTDRAIISDLPDKLEMKVYSTLTSEQATLYRAVVRQLEESLEESEGIQRSGLVLATLSKVKQICNHPAQFLGDNSAIPGRSGKLARLTEMLEEALEAGDKALLFTQFAEMGTILQKHLQETFGQEVLFLHGGTPKKHRDRMVERFQESGGPRLFLLSLKAGGTGLNLTAANHVFHFDRWWNPAVENQATDRAFRIGQKKNVQVHKFVCVGTLEERIDDMIENKQAIAGRVVGTGEEWLTKLSNTELKDLFALRAEATGDQ